MTEPRFLTFEDIEVLHRRSIERYGGTLGLRDRGGLEGAINQPRSTFYYGQGDLFDIAAAYAFHITEAQAYLDGNKRTAMAAALVFLTFNGCEARFEWKSLYDAMIGITNHEATKADLAAILLQQSSRQPEGG